MLYENITCDMETKLSQLLTGVERPPPTINTSAYKETLVRNPKSPKTDATVPSLGRSKRNKVKALGVTSAKVCGLHK